VGNPNNGRDLDLLKECHESCRRESETAAPKDLGRRKRTRRDRINKKGKPADKMGEAREQAGKGENFQ